MLQDVVNHSTVIIYAAKHYENCECIDDEEFFADLKRLKYIKRLFRKYEETGDLKERLVLNHIIILFNLFGQTAASRLLFYKLEGHYELLKPFLIFLGRCPEVVHRIGFPAKDINTSDIPTREDILERLHKI
jgi:hypothetical protein